MHMDVSNKAVDGILVQNGHRMAFKSCKLNNPKQRYLAHELEFLVVVYYL